MASRTQCILGNMTTLDDLDVLTPLTGRVDEADEPEVLSRHVRAAVLRALHGETDPDRRRELVNRILEDLKAHEDILVEAPSQLLSLTRPGAPGQVTLVDRGRPATPPSRDDRRGTRASPSPDRSLRH